MAIGVHNFEGQYLGNKVDFIIISFCFIYLNYYYLFFVDDLNNLYYYFNNDFNLYLTLGGRFLIRQVFIIDTFIITKTKLVLD